MHYMKLLLCMNFRFYLLATMQNNCKHFPVLSLLLLHSGLVCNNFIAVVVIVKRATNALSLFFCVLIHASASLFFLNSILCIVGLSRLTLKFIRL